MHLIYEALKKTDGNADGDALLAAMKGMAWESPRGPISIDPETRDIVQNIYIRKVEKMNGAALEHGIRDLRGREGSDEGRRQVSGRAVYTAILSISRVLPIRAATSRRIGPSLAELTGASVSALRASR